MTISKRRTEKEFSTDISKQQRRDVPLGNKIRKCAQCNVYTLKESCPECGEPSGNPLPARFSPLDPYGKYRRISKRREMEHA
ncbi:RNA-protein complex protein Nop10 [Methanococcoides vulcani]|uniref:RNA-protein complex protein Nop10 n=1 Tax=Methanococcoides vulcani TaxID=1353158 RepID=UPI00313D875A